MTFQVLGKRVNCPFVNYKSNCQYLNSSRKKIPIQAVYKSFDENNNVGYYFLLRNMYVISFDLKAYR